MKPVTWPGSFSVVSDEISQELDEVVAFVRRYQLGGFELRSMFGRAFKDLTKAEVARINEAARAAGLRIHGCATPVFKCPMEDAAATREHREIFQRSLEVARTLECNLLRVFTFLRRPAPLDGPTVERIAAHLAGLGSLATGSGVRIGIENENSCLIGSDEEMLALAPLLPGPAFGFIWDPCNVLYVPGAPPPSPHTFGRLQASILHVHVKDAVRRRAAGAGGSGMEAMPVGLGDVNWRAHLTAIKAAGYPGLLSLETHWRRERIDEKLLHLPAGHAFSRGGAEASATCLGNIQALCALLE